MRKSDQLRSRRRAARIRAYRQRQKRTLEALKAKVRRVKNALGRGAPHQMRYAKELADRLKLPQDIQRHLGLLGNFAPGRHDLVPLLLPMPSFRNVELLFDRILTMRHTPIVVLDTNMR